MPKKYIDADFVLEKFREKMIEVEYDEDYPPALAIPEGEVEYVIDNLPAADVQEVRDGHWIRDCLRVLCSECGEDYSDELFCMGGDINLCPNCGARMR